MVGTVLLVSGLGALAGMQICGPLADRWGSGRVTCVAVTAMALTVVVPLSATNTVWAFGGALLFGICTGAADVAMNAAAVEVERRYRRPIMASFHAVFSMGSVAGSAFAAAGFAVRASTPTAAAAAAVCCSALIAAVCRWLKYAGDAKPVDGGEDHEQRTAHPRRVAVLGALAFLLLLCEGAAMDWSSLHAQQQLAASPTLGAVAFGSFVTAMTIGRLCADRIAARVGPVAVVRWGCLLALAGIAVVVASPVLPLTIAGWVIFGLGLAGGAPQVFTAAGNLHVDSGRVLARVVGVGYLAIMAGPAVIGWLAEVSSLSAALVLPLCAVTVCAVSAASVGARR